MRLKKLVHQPRHGSLEYAYVTALSGAKKMQFKPPSQRPPTAGSKR